MGGIYSVTMTLKDYLEKIGQKPYLFAKAAGVSKDSVYKHRRGDPVSYETAERMSLATEGKVKTETIYRVGREGGRKVHHGRSNTNS